MIYKYLITQACLNTHKGVKEAHKAHTDIHTVRLKVSNTNITHSVVFCN